MLEIMSLIDGVTLPHSIVSAQTSECTYRKPLKSAFVKWLFNTI